MLQEPHTNLEKLGLYNRVRSCTVKVYSEFGSDHYHGTGVALKRFGDFVMIITSSHVVAMNGGVSPTVSVKPYDKARATTLPAYVVFENRADDFYFDLAFLVVRDPARTIAIAHRGADPDWKHKTVYSCGNPQTEEFLVDHGSVLPATAGPPEAAKFGWVVCHDALTEHGNSGGGLFDDEGKLVAINTWLYDDKVSMAIDIDVFDDLFDFRAATIPATSDEWMKDAMVPHGSSVYALAVGRWKCDPRLPSIDPGGYAGCADRCAVQGFNYGGAMMMLGDSKACFNHTHRGAGGSAVVYSDARTCQIQDAGGDLSFRINDRMPLDNTGAVAVFYLVVYPVTAMRL
jgi:hypothetical protein